MATTALTPANVFRPILSGSKEAIDIANIIAIPVLKIRAPSLKYNAPLIYDLNILIHTLIHYCYTPLNLNNQVYLYAIWFLDAKC